MKRFVRLLIFFVWVVLTSAALSSCLKGDIYGQYQSEENGGNGGSSEENSGGGNSSEGTSDNFPTATTQEGVVMSFQVVSETDKTCQVGTGSDAAISTSTTGTITIPTTVNGYTVIGIADRAFKDCSGLTKVVIPNTVTYIGTMNFESAMGAFHGCTGITSFDIPSSVVTIGRGAFSHCTKIIVFTMPESVKYLGSNAFDGCSSLTNITLSPNITALLLELFRNCTALVAIEIPAGVTEIGSNVFQNCTSLKTITSLIMEPFTTPSDAFMSYNITLIVPAGTKEKYQKTNYWGSFTTIKEAGSNDDPVIEDKGGECTWSVGDFNLKTNYAYWGYDTKQKHYMVYFTSFDVFKAVDLTNKEFRLPSKATIVEFDYKTTEGSSLPSGDFTKYDFSMLESDYTNYKGISFEQISNESVLSISRNGETYTVITSDAKLRGGNFTASSATGEPIVDEHTYYPVTLSYKGPLTQLTEDYMRFMFYDEIEYKRIIVDE